jgi:hypothetical protein
MELNKTSYPCGFSRLPLAEISTAAPKKLGRGHHRLAPTFLICFNYGFNCGVAFCNRLTSVFPDSGASNFGSVMITAAEASFPYKR